LCNLRVGVAAQPLCQIEKRRWIRIDLKVQVRKLIERPRNLLRRNEVLPSGQCGTDRAGSGFGFERNSACLDEMRERGLSFLDQDGGNSRVNGLRDRGELDGFTVINIAGSLLASTVRRVRTASAKAVSTSRRLARSASEGVAGGHVAPNRLASAASSCCKAV
jgi:hypothetical protein